MIISNLLIFYNTPVFPGYCPITDSHLQGDTFSINVNFPPPLSLSLLIIFERLVILGKIYNAIYNALARFDSFMSTLGQPKVDVVTSAAPTASQAAKDLSIRAQATATAEGIPTIVDGPIFDGLTIDGPFTDSPSSAKQLTNFSSSFGYGGLTSAATLDYLNADLAKHYGMNQTTAYNEALSNTAYQRAVKDLKAAGLNPAVLFGHGRVSGSEGVFGATPLSAGSGGSGGGSYSRRSGSGSSGKLFSSDSYAMISGAGALIGAVIGSKTGSIGLGAMTGSNIATSAAKLLNGVYQKYK